jgi:hypothetical protein
VDRAHGSVDHGRRWPKGSPELTLEAASVSGSSPTVGEKEKEKKASGVPTVGEGGRCGAGGRSTTVDRNGGGLELGVGRVEAWRGKAESGTRCGGGAAVLGVPFIVAGGESNGRKRRGRRRWWVLKTSVTR